MKPACKAVLKIKFCLRTLKVNALVCSEIIMLLTRPRRPLTRIVFEPKLLQKINFLPEMKPACRAVIKIKFLIGTLKLNALFCNKIIILLTRPRRPPIRTAFEPKLLQKLNFSPEMKPACRAVLKIKFLLGTLKVNALVCSKIIMLLTRPRRPPTRMVAAVKKA